MQCLHSKFTTANYSRHSVGDTLNKNEFSLKMFVCCCKSTFSSFFNAREKWISGHDFFFFRFPVDNKFSEGNWAVDIFLVEFRIWLPKKMVYSIFILSLLNCINYSIYFAWITAFPYGNPKIENGMKFSSLKPTTTIWLLLNHSLKRIHILEYFIFALNSKKSHWGHEYFIFKILKIKPNDYNHVKSFGLSQYRSDKDVAAIFRTQFREGAVFSGNILIISLKSFLFIIFVFFSSKLSFSSLLI